MGRYDVKAMHPGLAGKAFLISGHHGDHYEVDNRIIIDKSGGSPTENRPIQAIILPERTIVESNK
jgi:hypothetical protein